MNGGVLSVLEEMDRLRQDIDRVLAGSRAGRSAPSFGMAFLPGEAPRAYPLVNIIDMPERYRIDCLAPGLDPEGIEISVTGNQITVASLKAGPEGVPADLWHRAERATGRFQRTIQVSGDIERDRVSAEYRNGILSITVPKAERSRPRSIAVKVA